VIETSTSGGENQAPSTALLKRVLSHAAQVEIIEAPPDDTERADAARTTVSGPEITELARLLAVVDGGTGEYCRCLGWPTILVRDADGHQIAAWTLHHQGGIRGLGSCDAELRDAPALTEWLAEHGLTRSREIQHMLARQRDEAEQRRTAWVAAAPPALAEAAESVSRREDDAESALANLVAQRYPDPRERVRTLLAWASFPARHNDGTPWYELAPQRMLLAEPAESIYQALTSTPPTPAHLDGATELFTCFEWTSSPRAAIPEPLASHLVAHVEATGTDPMKFRMRHGYGTGRVA
jgi:hypothetical protein